MRKGTSNRTRVELKLKNGYTVYIDRKSSNRTRVELKLRMIELLPNTEISSNRTRVELKYAAREVMLSEKELLIVPEWN